MEEDIELEQDTQKYLLKRIIADFRGKEYNTYNSGLSSLCHDILNRLEQDERVIEEMANKLVREEKINIQCRPLKSGEYADVTKDIIDYFRNECE